MLVIQKKVYKRHLFEGIPTVFLIKKYFTETRTILLL